MTTTETANLIPLLPVQQFEIWVRIKKTSKYHEQGELEGGKSAFFKLEGFLPSRHGAALLSDFYSLKFNGNSYRREDCEFFLVNPADTKQYLRIA